MLIDKLWNFVMIKRKRVLCKGNITINGRIYIHGRVSGVKIGDNCTIQSAHYVNPTSGFDHTHLTTGKDGMIVIGNNVGISHANIISYNQVIIEDNVLIGSGVKIWDTDFHAIDYESRINGGNLRTKTAPIKICEGAFIGACAIILKGVTVGERSVVGAGSVVTKSIPDHEVWAGNPARKIGELHQ